MKTIAPEYLLSFSCIAGACRHSCCIGWEIDIDDSTLAYYQSLQGETGARLAAQIDTESEPACFKLDENERCPFLNEKGLCDLILQLGEESLCQICADHPRFRHFYSDRTEVGLGLCCEEAARLILSWEKPVQYAVIEDDGIGEEQDADEMAFFCYRDALTAIVQDRSLPMVKRIEQLMDKAGFSLAEPDTAFWTAFLNGLERLDEAWTERLERIKSVPRECNLDTLELPFEQLMVYLLYRHLLVEADEEEHRVQIAYAVLIWKLIRCMCVSDSFGDLLETVRLYSSELEYSDENIDAILAELRERWICYLD